MARLPPSVLTLSSSFFSVTRTCIHAWMSSNLGQIPPLTTKVFALKRLKRLGISCCHSNAYNFYRIFLILAGGEAAIKFRMGYKFYQIRSSTVELPALERLEKSL